MNPPSKRPHDGEDSQAYKRKKILFEDGRSIKSAKKQWRTPKKNQAANTALTINPGDCGIWATCDMHKEGKATAELRDLFEEYAVKIFGEDCLKPQVDADETDGGEDGDEEAEGEVDIEAEIASELQGMQKARSARAGSKHQLLFQAVRVDVQCVLFFKTRAPVEPVSFVNRICRDAARGEAVRRSRCVKRLTPMTRMGKASVAGLEEVARSVLGPAFHEEGTGSVKVCSLIYESTTLVLGLPSCEIEMI